tara:strand:+ start:693 stop:1652 length:960 start_codon:yes stop_codon:yes gene_type:complete
MTGEGIKAISKRPSTMEGRGGVESWIVLFRTGNSVTGIFGVILGASLATRGFPSGEQAIITFLHALSVMTFMFSWNALNDLFDVEIDRINRPDRPLPSGKISIQSAKIGIAVTGMASIISLLVAAFVAQRGETGIDNWTPALLIWASALFLLFNYESPSSFSLRMKDRGLPGNIAISLSVGLVIIFGAAGVSRPLDHGAWSVFVVGFCFNLSREIVKDIEDIRGDRGRTTFAMSAGLEKSRFVAWLILLAALVSLLFPFIPETGIFNPWQVVFVIPGIVTLIMVKKRLFSSEDHAAQQLIKRSMQLCLVAFFFISVFPF